MNWWETETPAGRAPDAERMVRDDVPPMFRSGAPVPSTPRVWGDKEAEAAGLYEKPGAAMSFAPERPAPTPQAAPQATGAWWESVARPMPQNDGFEARFPGQGAGAPQRPDELSAAMAQRARGMTGGPPVSAPVQMATDFQNQGLAASQGTTPIISAQAKNLLSAEVHQNDAGEIVFRDPATGQMVPTDQNKHVILRDPADNRLKVYARTEDTSEGRLAGLGRILGTGALAGAPTARAMAVSGKNLVQPTAQPTGLAVAEAAERLSATGSQVTVPKFIASDKWATQQLGSVAQYVPLAGARLEKAPAATLAQLGTKADEVAAGYGAGAASPEVAGAAAQEGIRNWVTGTSKARVKQLYDRVDDLVDPAITTDLNSTRNMAAQIAARREQAAMAGQSKAVQLVQDAVTRPGGLNYFGVKDLRSSIGEMLKGGILPEGVSGSELKQIYGALSDDLRMAVGNAGGARAVSAFERANKFSAQVSERRETLSKIIGLNGDAPPAAVFDRLLKMAQNTSRADTDTLMQARKAIGSENWGDFASGIVGRLGRGDNNAFSPDRFITAWSKLSPQGKAALFRTTGQGDLAQHLDDIATISSRFKDMNKFKNHSGTARQLIGAGSAGTFIADPVNTAAIFLGANVVARMLSQPATAAAMSRWSRTYEAVAKNSTPAKIAVFNIATRNLQMAAQDVAGEE